MSGIGVSFSSLRNQLIDEAKRERAANGTGSQGGSTAAVSSSFLLFLLLFMKAKRKKRMKIDGLPSSFNSAQSSLIGFIECGRGRKTNNLSFLFHWRPKPMKEMEIGFSSFFVDEWRAVLLVHEIKRQS